MNHAKGGARGGVVVLLCLLLISVGFIVWLLVNQSPGGHDLASCRGQLQSCQTQRSSLQSQLTSAEGQISSLQTQLSSYRSQVSLLQSELSECQKRGKLLEWSLKADEKTINQGAGSRSRVAVFRADYAGYIYVSGTSTTSNGYVMVTSTFGGYPHNDHRYSFGHGRTLIIPILPGTIEVYFGNTNLFGGASATITVYYVH